MSTLTIQTFQPQINWPYGGSTATLRIKYSAPFTDSTSQAVLRGLYKDVPCTIAAGVLTVPEFTLITTNDALVNPLVTCSAQFFDSNGAARDWLFQQFSIPQSLTPSATIAALFTYNQGAALVRPPSFYLNRDQTAALIAAMMTALGLGPATNLALGTVLLSIAAVDPANPIVWGTNDPLVRDALKLMGIDLDALVATPADGNVLGFDAASGTYKPLATAIPSLHAASHEDGGTDEIDVTDLSGLLADPQIPLPHAVLHQLGGADQINVGGLSGVLADPQTPVAHHASHEPGGSDALEVSAASRLIGRGDSGAGAIEEIDLGAGLLMTGTQLSAPGAAGGDIKSDGSVAFAADESMGGFSLTNLASPDDLTDAANKDFVLQSVAAAVQQTPNITALVSGGGVLWEADYDFRVSQATYLIQGDLFSSAETVITLDAADPTLDRIDVIALDNTGTVVKITGTAAAQPSQPDVDPGTQLLLTFVFVGAATTAPPNVTNEDIYIDNTEWTASTSGLGWDPDSTNNPRSGTKDIEGSNVANNAFVQLEAPAPLTLDQFALLSLFIQSKATWPKNRSLLLQWYSAGVAKGVGVTINTGFFGFDSSQTATYQLLAIPISQFAVPAGTSLNQLRITDKGGAIGMFIDDIVLQAFGGDIGSPPTPGLTQSQADARYLQIANNLSELSPTGTGVPVLATSPTLVTPALGTPASGNLSNCTADGTNGVGFKNIPQNSQSADYTIVAGDAGKHVYHPVADDNPRTFTIDSNTNVPYPIGTAITFVNDQNTLTIAITDDALVWSEDGSTGPRTLAENGMATALKVTATRWIISGTGLS